jgi:ribose 5-phosphate isomerase B
MRIAVGSDERTSMTDSVIAALREQQHEFTLFGPLAGQTSTWPVVARDVAEAVAQGDADEGILICWTGTGVSIAANKVPGIRAALCDDAETARGARLWNNANILCLSIRRLSEVMAKEVLLSWFSTLYKSNPEDDACIKDLTTLEEKYAK